jgi:triacylglycerol lipase
MHTGKLLCTLAMGWLGLRGPVRAGENERPVNVVLVHGFHATGRIFGSMIRDLEHEGCQCFAPTLRPSDCSRGVHELACQLSAQIDRRFGPSAPLVIVGFSMGGLVTRDYVQNLAHRGRVRAAFLISAPNHGTLWASLSPESGQRQMAPGSPFLSRLNADDTAWSAIPVSSYWTPYDLVILPPKSSLLAFGESERVACPVHWLMVKDRTVRADIAAKIGRLREPAARPAHRLPGHAFARRQIRSRANEGRPS